ncbi:uncharacterized protein I303_104419 [Kwoniella dejecticola CBS 10117]|uniref:Uncharacterized protein n=1 Tax=Kwoniella dejecticola CBS 10117 TaxID=1296121 RepID=A0A1A6A5D6_9TREE|nr:uncharacterized protein I303_04602 [Kwoniella dejecticola CBS 10117]OBR85269.1 hypothetical protein I303_04602 [Kwoniella dejecticola CBS 10117]
MSYYRPSTLIATTTLTHLAPEASSSRLPVPPTIQEEGSEGPQAAAQTDKGKGKEKKVRRLTIEEMERLAGQICNVRPIGACRRPQSASGLYCTNHSCQAINADGDRCGNWVANPQESRFCANGWHMENSRHTLLADLMNLRKSLDQRQRFERDEQNAAQLTYIEQRFPSSSSASSSSSDCSPSTILRTPISSTTTNSASSRLFHHTDRSKKEQGWGSHGVDAWWRGKWELNSGVSELRRSSS